VIAARSRSLLVSAHHLAAELFQPGSGYGAPEARDADVHRLETARAEVERLFREYQDGDGQHIESEMLEPTDEIGSHAGF
jgi:hypothetical protein